MSGNAINSIFHCKLLQKTFYAYICILNVHLRHVLRIDFRIQNKAYILSINVIRCNAMPQLNPLTIQMRFSVNMKSDKIIYLKLVQQQLTTIYRFSSTPSKLSTHHKCIHTLGVQMTYICILNCLFVRLNGVNVSVQYFVFNLSWNSM